MVKQVERYICEICGMEYADEDGALDCEIKCKKFPYKFEVGQIIMFGSVRVKIVKRLITSILVVDTVLRRASYDLVTVDGKGTLINISEKTILEQA